jgi:hypothetical protein
MTAFIRCIQLPSGKQSNQSNDISHHYQYEATSPEAMGNHRGSNDDDKLEPSRRKTEQQGCKSVEAKALDDKSSKIISPEIR